MVQWGGTGILTLDEFRPRTFQQMGSDPTNLGRWTWARIQGRHNMFTRIVSAYKPCKNTSNLGSSYQQQLRYFRSHDMYTCPRELFDTHLQHQLQEWMAAGDHIIIGLDLNDDARDCPTQRMLTSLGLRDAILDLHTVDEPPETNKRNSSGTPIDAIFATPGIVPSKGGYMPYGQIMDSDHRVLWIDIPFTSILGYNPPHLNKPQLRPVNAKDPRSYQRFAEAAKKEMQQENCDILQNLQRLKDMRHNDTPLLQVIATHAALLEETIKYAA